MTLFLLYPEWQGSGASPSVQRGALTIARELFPDTAFLVIPSPEQEQLRSEQGVKGLASIGPRFLEAMAQLRRAAPDRIVTVGGTCGVEAAPIGYLNERYGGELAVVWLDAHGDLNTPESSPSGNFHGMVLRTLLGDGPAEYVAALRRPLHHDQVFLAGTRDLDPPEAEFVARQRIAVTPPDTFARPHALIDTIAGRGFARVYVHVDLDVLSPGEFPDTLMRTPGGPGLLEVCAMLRALAAAFDVTGFSLVEYVHGDETALGRLATLLDAAGIDRLC